MFTRLGYFSLCSIVENGAKRKSASFISFYSPLKGFYTGKVIPLVVLVGVKYLVVVFN